jgi:3-deoxy-D-manno-octulosonate 8-phosphate phosphatase (KDO 8-P phosphatase)
VSETIYQRFKKIKAIAMDVDGVLTDGTLLCTDSGEWVRRMNIKDGYAISHAVKNGLHLAVISGSIGEGVKIRMKRLGLEFVYQDVADKSVVLKEWMESTNVKPEEVIFIGDDMPDIPALKLAGLPCCPKDAVPEVMEACQYISPFNGGDGCVRDIIEKVMKLHGTWNA